MRKQIESRLRKVLADNVTLNVPIEELALEDDLNHMGVNSISYIKFIVAVEEEYDIEFDDDQLTVGNLKNLDMFLDYIESKVK